MNSSIRAYDRMIVGWPIGRRPALLCLLYASMVTYSCSGPTLVTASGRPELPEAAPPCLRSLPTLTRRTVVGTQTVIVERDSGKIIVPLAELEECWGME